MCLNIPITEERRKLDEIIHVSMHYPKHADNQWNFDPNLNKINNLLISIPRIKLLEVWHYDNPYQRCQWYAFHNEEWYQELSQMDEMCIELMLIENGLKILPKMGYKEIEKPAENAIVVYHFADERTSKKHIPGQINRDWERAEHYGICESNNIRSKWSHSHVYEHPIELVPAAFGDVVRYFKKC